MKKYFLFLLILSIISLIPVREILSMVKPDSLEAENLYKKAEDYWRDVRYDSSNFYYEKASSLFQENKDWERYIECQNNIGANYRYLGNFAEAISHLNMGIDAINNLDENQDSLRIKLYNNIGFVYFEMGYFDKAYKYYSSMLGISERVFGTKDINTGRGYQNIGLIYYSTGDYAKALRYLDKAYSIFSADSEKYNIQLANCYTNYSKIYLSKKDYSSMSFSFNADPGIMQFLNSLVPIDITTDRDSAARFYNDPNTADTGEGTPPVVDMGAYEYHLTYPVCGDAEHPILAADLNRDCIIDFKDLAYICESWLICTKPECE